MRQIDRDSEKIEMSKRDFSMDRISDQSIIVSLNFGNSLDLYVSDSSDL